VAPYYKRNLFILSITVFLASTSWQQIVPFLPKFLKEIGGGGEHFELWVSLIFASQSLAAIIAQPSWGKLGDNLGRKPMILRAGFCLSGIYFAMSICHAPWQLLICRFLNGALTGFIPGAFSLVSTNTPEDKAPRYVAILESTANIGLIVGPSLGGVMAYCMGYRFSMTVSSIAVLLATLAVWAFVEEPNKVHPVEKTSLAQDFGMALKSSVMSSLMVTIMLAWAFGNSINPFLIIHLDQLSGWRPWWFPSLTYSLPGIAFVLSAYRWSVIGQKIGFDKTIIIGMSGVAIGGAALFFIHNIWLFALVFFLTGLCLATLSPGAGAITCTRVPQDFRGRAYGIQQSSGTFASFCVVLLSGQIAKHFGFSSIFLFVAGMYILGLIVFKRKVAHWDDGGDADFRLANIP